MNSYNTVAEPGQGTMSYSQSLDLDSSFCSWLLLLLKVGCAFIFLVYLLYLTCQCYNN